MTAPSLGAYARSLAKPVLCGLMPLPLAQNWLRALAVQRARAGTLEGDGDPEGAFTLANDLLDQHLLNEWGVIAETYGRIRRAIKPMIALRQPVNAVRAQAHDINGADGFPLSEDDVDRFVTEQLWWALQPIRGARRHG